MAQVVKFRAGLTFGDSKNILGSVDWNINTTMFTAYSGAADASARLATPVGAFMAGLEGLSGANVFERRVYKVIEEDTAVFPADGSAIYNHDKITVSYRAGADNYTLTIPSRKNTVIATGMVDGVINIQTGVRTSEVDAFFTAFANGLIAKNGSQGIIQKMSVNR